VRNFPLAIHPHAREAARWAEAADRLGRYLEFHDALLSGPVDLSDSGYLVAARGARLPFDDLQRMAASLSVEQSVEMDVTMAKRLNLQGTPTFILVDEKGICWKLGASLQDGRRGRQ
jgi:protein-disulfide isomerase